MNNHITLPFLYRVDAVLLVAILFILMIAAIRLGTYLGRRRILKNQYHENPANATINGSIFGLLALLLAFTFGMSGSRYDARRQAVITEANAIGTAILRADLYPDTDRIVLRRHFKNYLQAKIDYINAGGDIDKVESAENAMNYHQALLWAYVTGFSKKNSAVIISGQMIPALNTMFDSANTTRNNELLKVPQPVVIMLFILSVFAAFILGYMSVGKGLFDWFTGVDYSLLISLVVFITLDLDRQRHGLIRMDSAWQSILSLQRQFDKK